MRKKYQNLNNSVLQIQAREEVTASSIYFGLPSAVKNRVCRKRTHMLRHREIGKEESTI